MGLLEANNPGIRAKIMVVEDEPVVAQDIEESLRHLGYDVTGTAASAEDCLSQALARRPDLVLMDVRIQGELDGIETAKLLRDRFDVPVVYLTAYVDSRTVERARESEAHGYILKPFRAGELRSTVEIALYKHRMETKLRERERWFKTTLRAIGEAVIAVDTSGKVAFMNLAAEQLTGKREDEARGQKLGNVFHLIDERTREPLESPVRHALGDGLPSRLPPHTALQTADGECPIDDSVAPIVDEEGKLLGAVIVFRDVSEERRLHEQVALNDRLASLGVLAAGIAHEINNPLTYVLANAAVAERQLGVLSGALEQLKNADDLVLSAVRQHVVEIVDEVREIQHGAERVKRIVSDLRVFARPEAGGQNGDVVAALEWALRVTDNQLRQRARVVTEIRPVPRVSGSDVRLGQVFLNLLLNAVHAIAEGNPAHNVITVTTGRDEQGRVLVSIGDTGSGMSPEIVRRIFEPFFTTKAVGSGTGLGLSICHGIVDAMGGEIALESAPGKGTTFRVHLPADKAAAQAPSGSELGATALSGRILLVDDEARLVAAVARMLRPLHEVATAASGKEALEKLATDRNFDIVLCDLMMPEMSGMDLYERLLVECPEIAPRMVFVTGGAFSARAVDFLASTPNAHLVKPFTRSHIHEFLQSVLKRRLEGAEPGPEGS